ncbi:MAG: bacillithiol biosynthesis cysteine-adding enzyme BshC [Gemmatimonadota bacterium]
MSGGLRIVRRPFGSEGSLGARYAAGDEAVISLLAPTTPDGAASDRAELDAPEAAEHRCDRRIDPEVFHTSSPEAARKLKAVLNGDGAFVTTGHQPCLLLGPLYVLYKALTAIEVAVRLESRLGIPVLPLFWVASDDHDWDEVGSTCLVDTANALRRFRLEPPPGRAGRSVGETVLDEPIRDLMSDVWQAVPQSEFITDYIKLFEDAYRPGRSIGEAFGVALEGTLQGRELVWLDAAEARVKAALAPMYRRALLEAAEAEGAVVAGTERVRSAGFEAQLAVPAGASNVFYDDGTARLRVYVSGRSARIGRAGPEKPLADLISELEERPEAFGPSAALRPVAESCLLPVAATVLGPSEIGYWAQLPDLFAWAGLDVPRVVPRTGWIVMEAKVTKVLNSLAARPEDLSDGGVALAGRTVRAGRPDSVAEALAELQMTQEAAFDSVAQALAEEIPGIRATAEKARAGARKALRQLERAVDGSVRERQSVLRGQIEKAALHLFPGGVAQERVMSPIYYLARYGTEFLEQLDREVRDEVEEYIAGPGRGLGSADPAT